MDNKEEFKITDKVSFKVISKKDNNVDSKKINISYEQNNTDKKD